MEPENKTPTTKKDHSLPISIVIAAVFIAGAWIYSTGFSSRPASVNNNKTAAGLAEIISPKKGFLLPVNWGDMGIKLSQAGVIDEIKFKELMASRGEFDETAQKMLYGADNKKIAVTPDNANTMLNFFWALGLGNKNEILEQGPISQYGQTNQFASTGGWTLARGDVMDHYSMHPLIDLTPEQQKLVEEVSKNIYRPCCNNPTHFPDCNHGMAMLGLLELMASQGASREIMYQTALKVNAYWFPDQYLTIAKFLKSKNIDWNETSPEKILAKEFSSGSGYQWVSEQVVQPEESEPKGGCAV
ncbi:MAG: hypothetical protein HYT38_02985 [Candidatus Sungbacteria bacterium]|uniref:Uncharacterized protein n=2 Tax=Candidatus Sungiibacteriota bacterium TaxID=2750080 RepID=A0A9D6HR83_9BACT|nr:hypothetical protein [Candidatus Sungbacteria bacterium]